jgi:hypothetical protein
LERNRINAELDVKNVNNGGNAHVQKKRKIAETEEKAYMEFAQSLLKHMADEKTARTPKKQKLIESDEDSEELPTPQPRTVTSTDDVIFDTDEVADLILSAHDVAHFYHPTVVETTSSFGLFWPTHDFTIKAQVIQESNNITMKVTVIGQKMDMTAFRHATDASKFITSEFEIAVSQLPEPTPFTFEISLPEDIIIQENAKIDDGLRYGVIFARMQKNSNPIVIDF